MPVATPVPDALTPLLRHRLVASLPPQDHVLTCRALNNLLLSLGNVPADTHTPPPSDRASPWPMAQVYLRLVTPLPGSQAGPFTAAEARTVHLLHYLHEVERARPLEANAALGTAHPQSQIHAHLLHEVRREFRLLPCQVPPEWLELAVADIASKLLVKSIQLGVEPTEVRMVGAQELLPVDGHHQGGLKLTLAAWNAAAPPPELPTSPEPNVWDPDNPLGNGTDLLRAPVQLEWTGVTPLTSR